MLFCIQYLPCRTHYTDYTAISNPSIHPAIHPDCNQSFHFICAAHTARSALARLHTRTVYLPPSPPPTSSFVSLILLHCLMLPCQTIPLPSETIPFFSFRSDSMVVLSWSSWSLWIRKYNNIELLISCSLPPFLSDPLSLSSNMHSSSAQSVFVFFCRLSHCFWTVWCVCVPCLTECVIVWLHQLSMLL